MLNPQCWILNVKIYRSNNESKKGKNLHLEHIEDEIINHGVDGGSAINFLRSLRDMLSGSSRSSVRMTVKWDGACNLYRYRPFRW